MNLQQFLALILVSLAAIYLARNMVRALRSFLSGKSGCGDGCGKCGFAPTDSPGRPAETARRPDIIPLSEIRSLPKTRER